MWRQIIDERHDEERAERIAIEFYYHSIERRVLNRWKLVRKFERFKLKRKEFHNEKR